MKIRLLLSILTCALVSLPSLRAQDDSKKEDQTELGSKMEKISGAFRRLRNSVKDPSKNEDSLKQVAIIRANAEAALQLEPAKKADLPADQQEKFVADFHDKMKGFIADVDKLDAALKAGNNDEAVQLLTTMKQDQTDGHKEFQKKKKKKAE